MEVLVWALGIISALLVAFISWIASAVVEIKRRVAVIEEKLSTGDKKHDDFDARIEHLEDSVHKMQMDIAVLITKGER